MPKRCVQSHRRALRVRVEQNERSRQRRAQHGGEGGRVAGRVGRAHERAVRPEHRPPDGGDRRLPSGTARPSRLSGSGLLSPLRGATEPVGAHRRLDDLDPAFLRAVGDLTLPPQWIPPRGAAMGPHLNTLDGDSLEFKQHRTYTPGDDVRRVDWSLYGRSKRLYTRLVQDEHQPRLVLALDTSASMATGGWQDKFRSTIELTLQLALIGLNSGYAVRVMPFGDSVVSERARNALHARQSRGSNGRHASGALAPTRSACWQSSSKFERHKHKLIE